MRKFHRKTPVLESPFIKVAGFAGSATLLKKYSNTGVFLWNLLKKTYFVEHLQTAASGSCKHSIWTCYKIRIYTNIETKSLKMLWEGVQFSKV